MRELSRSSSFRVLGSAVFFLGAACASSRPHEPVVGEPASTQASATPPAELATPAREPILGQPLLIHGRAVAWDEIRRAVCEGTAGVDAIERAKLSIFIGEEIRRRIKSGESAEPDEAEVNAFRHDLEREFVTAGGELDVRREFEKLFLPRDPDKFPPATIDALMKDPGGQAIIDHYRDTFEKNDPDPEPRDAAELEFDEAVEQMVIDYLLDVARIEPDPMPGVLSRVNGVDLRTADIWAEILPSLSEADVREAKQWILNTTLLREAFEQAGAWLSDEEAEAAYHAHSDPYRDSRFSVERIALLVKRFPSVERYKEYRRIYESFERMKAAEMTPEALEKQAAFRTNPIVGQVTVDVDVILCSAWDFERKRWKENGWAEAAQRMIEVQRALVDGGVEWDECVERYSELPASTEGEEKPSGMPSDVKGRIRHIQRNPLMERLGESEYLQFLNGTSLTDSIFFEQEPGTLGTPTRGAFGWYLPRLIRRSRTPAKLQVDAETMHVLEVDDYVQWNLNLWAQELLQRDR